MITGSRFGGYQRKQVSLLQESSLGTKSRKPAPVGVVVRVLLCSGQALSSARGVSSFQEAVLSCSLEVWALPQAS